MRGSAVSSAAPATQSSSVARDRASTGGSRLLAEIAAADRDRAAEILASSATIEVTMGKPHFRQDFANAALLVVEDGFTVVRAAARHLGRSIITCEAGPGRVLLPPADDEMLFGLTDSTLTPISQWALDQLLALPGTAKVLHAELTVALAQKQEAIGNFANTHHIERVRRKLLQLSRNYGRVVRDGIRIDFPISHSVLAEMVGSSRETVTRSIDALQRDGFVARDGHTYRLLVSPDTVASATRP